VKKFIVRLAESHGFYVVAAINANRAIRWAKQRWRHDKPTTPMPRVKLVEREAMIGDGPRRWFR
jgi:hypothetical protein